MSLRVVLASHSAGLDAGAERSLLQVALYLNKHDCEVAVIVPGDGALAGALRAGGVEAVALGYEWARPRTVKDATDRSLSALQDIAALLRSLRPDVLMTNTVVIPWFGFVANQLGIPHAWFIREDLSSDPGFAYPDVERTLQIVRTSADGVFVPSAYMRDLYRRLLDRQDIRVVYPTFDPSITDWASRRPGSTGRRIVVCATITPHKNQLEALRAAAILHEQGREFELTIMGGVASQEYMRQLRDFVREQDLENLVAFAAPTDDPYAILAGHDICVVPSTNEPSSRVMVEAMLVGTAVVASDVGGNVEKAGGDRSAAVLYPLGHADVLAERLAMLLDHRQLQREQAATGQSYAVEMYVERDQLAPLLAGLQEIARLSRRPQSTWIIDELLQRSAEYARLQSAISALQDHEQSLRLSVQRNTSRVAELEFDLATLAGHIEALQVLATAYATSRSWRLTEPARAVGRGARRLIGNARRTTDA